MVGASAPPVPMHVATHGALTVRFEPRGHTAGRLDVGAMREAAARAASPETPHTLDLRRVPGRLLT